MRSPAGPARNSTRKADVRACRRPSIFGCLMIGYFEGLDSERGIDWRCSDSLSLREFLGYVSPTEFPSNRFLN